MKTGNNIHQTIDHLFRRESGKMVAVLVKIFGSENLELAEDVVQDALVNALETWKFNGIPENPPAWLYRTARNKAIDIIRRKKHSRSFDFSDPERRLLASEYTLVSTMETYWQESHIKNDFLGMMYAACHPEISLENQITFILKSLCGFSTKEVAKAFLTTEDTISKRLYRTKEYFRLHKIRPEIPSLQDMEPRTNAVLNTIYLMFNEGYNSTHYDDLIRKDVIFQAMYLCKCLLENERTRLPEAFALMALMCFHSSRLESRLTSGGELILLPQQDRSKWNREWIAMGNEYMNKAAFGDKISSFHLEAAIAYEHSVASTYESTNWSAIISWYDTLLTMAYDPVIYLNRSLAVMELKGPQEALEALEKIKDNRQMQNYYLFHAAFGEVYRRMGKNVEAVRYFETAFTLTQSAIEKSFLRSRIAELSN